MSVYILGVSALYHDSAACLIHDGKIIAAAHEERFTRKKHDAAFPLKAIQYCLKEAGITEAELTHVAFYEKPVVKFDRILQTAISSTPWGIKPFLMAMPIWLKERLWMYEYVHKKLPIFKGKLIFTTHHEAHAASAFFPSPFQQSAVLTLDASGEWNTVTYGVGNGNTFQLKKAINFPHSLGMLYSAFTYYCGFKVNSGEYKLMGLAPYGVPRFVEVIKKHLIEIKEDGSFQLNMKYFGYVKSLYMTNRHFNTLFGEAARKPEEKLRQFHMDVAASIQVVTEEVVCALARHIRKETGQKNLCLAGGVALNCVANARIEREKIFDSIWVQPAAGDAGGALGAAQFVWFQHLKNERVTNEKDDGMSGSYLGPEFSNEEIEEVLKSESAVYEKLSTEVLIDKASSLLASEKVVGWFQGKMEYGPRALGARSILGDARSTHMQQTMNLKIKFRESFRPFAPSVLEEDAGNYFEGVKKGPYMLFTYFVQQSKRKDVESGKEGLDKLMQVRSDIPAVTHVDYSARVQTVSKDTNPRYHALLTNFKNKTGYGLLINTSFNVRGEPIVCTPLEAYKCFENTNMDYLAIGDFLVKKEVMKSKEEMDAWAAQFEAD